MIYLNNTAIPMQPATLDETPAVVKTDQYSINGKLSRNVGDSRKRSAMGWTFVDQTTMAFIDSLYDSQTEVTYKNDASPRYGTLEFTGVLSVSTDKYVRGGSGLIPLSITIEEGTTYPL